MAEAKTQEKRPSAAPIDPRLIKRARATRTYMIAGVVVGSLMAVLILGQAHLLSGTIASVFETHTLTGLTGALILLVVVLIGRAILAWASSWLAQRTSAAVKSQLRQDILSSRLGSPAHLTSSSSNLVTLVTHGLDSLDGYFSKYLPQLLLAVTVPVIVGIYILVSDWRSFLVILATIPFIPALMMLVGWTTQRKVSQRWKYQSRLASHFADLIAGLPTLQVFGRAKAQAEGLKRTEHANQRETMGILRLAFLSAFVLEMFSTIAVAVIALIIGTRLVYSQMEFSTALLILILAPEVYLPIRQVGVHYHDSAHGLAAAEAAFAEIDRRVGEADSDLPAIIPDSGSYDPSIQVRNLTYTYPGSDTIVGPFDLDVTPGEILALAGKSGGGKTTLLNCVLGFLTPESPPGADPMLTLSGINSNQIDWEVWRAGIAYVPQIPGMINGTIADNIRLGFPEATEAQVRAVLTAAGASNLEPNRDVGEEGEGLSVGERRRVGIARALARIELGGARLLILDEPTAGLDTDTEAKVLLSVRQSGATAVVVSHRPAVLEAADRVVEIHAVALAAVAASEGEALVSELADPAVQETDIEQADSPAEPQTQYPHSIDQVLPGLEFKTASSKDATQQIQDQPEVVLKPLKKGGSPLMRLVFALLDSVPNAKFRLFLAIVIAACASGAAIALMGVSAWLISLAAQHPPYLDLSIAAVGVRFFGISRGVFRYLERLVGHQVALSMQSALRMKTYQTLAKTTLLGRRQGDLLVRVVSDVAAIEDIIVRIVQPFLAASLVVVGVCALLARFSIGASLAILVSAIVGGIIVPWLTQRVSLQADEAMVPLRGEMGVVVHDLSRNAIDLAAYGAQAKALARLAAIDLELRKNEERAAWAKGIGAGLQMLASGIGFIGGLWIGSIAVANGSMGERLLAVVVLVPLALHEVFANFAQAAQTWTRARVALNRVTAILDAPPVGVGDVEVRAQSEEPSLHCKDLAVGWPGYPPVATGLELDVTTGQAVGVMGHSGVGKTTLAATIMGLIPKVDGELTSTGRVGYLAQDAHIFTTTIAENVRIGNKDATDDEVRAALIEAGLDVPLDREVGEMGVGLSGGEARRLALSRLFAGNYRLLILDEPTEHLDRETADALMDELFAGVQQRPVVVISHDESVAARCDRVLTMD